MSDALKWHNDLKASVVYSYWKDADRLVTAGYAKKVLMCGDKKLKTLLEKYNIQAIERKSPTINFKTKLYNLQELYRIKQLENIQG